MIFDRNSRTFKELASNRREEICTLHEVAIRINFFPFSFFPLLYLSNRNCKPWGARGQNLPLCLRYPKGSCVHVWTHKSQVTDLHSAWIGCWDNGTVGFKKEKPPSDWRWTTKVSGNKYHPRSFRVSLLQREDAGKAEGKGIGMGDPGRQGDLRQNLVGCLMAN